MMGKKVEEETIDEAEVEGNMVEEGENSEGEDTTEKKKVEKVEEKPKLLEQDIKGEFKASVETEVLKSYVKMVNALLDEGEVSITPNKIEVLSLDSSQISLVRADLTPKVFEQYKLDGTDEMKVCLNFKELKNLLSKVEEKKIDILVSERYFRIHSDTIDYQGSILEGNAGTKPKTPPVDFDGSFSLDKSETLRKLLGKCLGKFVSFTYNGELRFNSEDDISQISLKVNGLTPHFKKEAKANYNLDVLDDMGEGLKGCEKVKFDFGNEKPLRVSWSGEGRSVEYFLAPRIDQ